MRESIEHLAGLRRQLATMAGSERDRSGDRFETGHEGLDAALGGGLGRGRLHELFAGEGEDAASAIGMAAMLALRAGSNEATQAEARERKPKPPIAWLRMENAQCSGGHFHAPGFAELGGDPDRLLLALAPDALSLLRCAADAVRCAGVGAVVIETWGRCPALDLTASRRLSLAAGQSGVTVILLRMDASPVPSAADTRWAVRAAPSCALEAGAPGAPVFEIELLRRRAGPSGMRWRVEWNRDQCVFREPALSGALVPLSPRRTAAMPPAAELRRRA